MFGANNGCTKFPCSLAWLHAHLAVGVFKLGKQGVEAGTRARSGLLFNLARKEKWGHGGHTCTIFNTPFLGLTIKYTLDWGGAGKPDLVIKESSVKDTVHN